MHYLTIQFRNYHGFQIRKGINELSSFECQWVFWVPKTSSTWTRALRIHVLLDKPTSAWGKSDVGVKVSAEQMLAAR